MKYKLTDEKGQTHGGCQWGENVTHTAEGKGKTLCSSDVIHYYEDTLLAVFANPVHANFRNPILWEFKPQRKIGGDALKSACKTGRTIRQIPLPEITTLQKVEIGIRCVMLIYTGATWLKWAEGWLSGKAANAAYAAANAANAAAYAAANAAAYAAYAAANASYAANAANAASYAAANAAAYAASYASYAASYAASLIKIIHQVVDKKGGE